MALSSSMTTRSFNMIISVKKDDGEEIIVETKKAEGEKCSVCWKIKKDKCERHGCAIK